MMQNAEFGMLQTNYVKNFYEEIENEAMIWSRNLGAKNYSFRVINNNGNNNHSEFLCNHYLYCYCERNFPWDHKLNTVFAKSGLNANKWASQTKSNQQGHQQLQQQ
ncbi:hypothetical protein PHYBLDRAFT_163238 [Phycomyces blakesleeanus NRRL 1555(-)]|uniref:Uncharacterized protein n=1 Tax=Phycomyces blakesleeanus (strain ATCC 8743b / DSM 1359 / FGSC 10004 / NBRC 33097 / NRRL 1555) TaxID=763407 RepID=A0A167QSZ1_PHYB8|nr:hypothetical protein PHYBLDRAFT_163238 [Phycomyces blakesleeanus NRRL 1555(-)]OAD80210.1 hypothetical protein PHYBLDRAFT_163238 [Phycomyces blakesleeanus NRRL 1555(-)]|eukprot:XP_018298250.1 hypothetical protein PHYBLDRAFT_163238 [Phycomyces blakesleeanus NRRL 1555(-)]